MEEYSAGILTRLRPGRPRNQVSFSGRGRRLLQSIRTNSGKHQLSSRCWGSSAGSKTAGAWGW